MRTKTYCVLALAIVASNLAIAQQPQKLNEVIVTDSRFERPKERSGRSVVKLTQKDIAPFLGGTLADLLSHQAGIHINGANTHAGNNLGYFIRGGNNRQVLVIIDGIPVSDPSQIENDFDLRLIDLSSVASVEILKGASSSLYGSSAATAVIKITTRRQQTTPFEGRWRSYFATNNTQDESIRSADDVLHQLQLKGGGTKTQFDISISRHSVEGMSAVLGTEEDPVNRLNFNGYLSSQLTPKLRVSTLAQRSYFQTGYDDTFPALADADNHFTSRFQTLGMRPEWQLNKATLTASISWTKSEREFESEYPSQKEANNRTMELVYTTELTKDFQALLGLHHQRQESQGLSRIDLFDPFVNILYKGSGAFQAQVGARWNDHSLYGSQWTYHINPSFLFEGNNFDLRLYAGASTAFIAPSLFKLFDIYSGNQDLLPETNTSLELGTDFLFHNDSQFGLVYFNRHEENFVAYDLTTFRYLNTTEDFRVHGLEIVFNASLMPKLDLDANYTFTEKKDEVALRIPKHKANLSFRYQALDNMQLVTNYQYTGSRNDLVSGNTVALDSYQLWDLTARYSFTKTDLRLQLSVNNIFDEHYEEISGFTTLGRNFRIGVELPF